MAFFNKKEEVIDLQLTQYGKYLLSMGKLKPVFYAFYDDGIIYDYEYAGITETQNESEGRIQEETPKLKTFYNFHSIEDDIQRAVSVQESGDPELAQMMLQQTPEKSQTLVNPLGNSDMASDKAPAWTISLLGGEILTGSTTSTLTLSGSETVLNIPQIETEIKYEIVAKDSNTLSTKEIEDLHNEYGTVSSLVYNENGDVITPNNILDLFNIKVYDDGSFFSIDKDDLVFEIIEENVPHGNDNFEIELFLIEDVDGDGKIKNTSLVTEVQQMRLMVEPDLVVDDILIDMDQANLLPISKIDSSFGNYYFDIELDDEIDAGLICERLEHADEDLYKFARKDFECPDTRQDYLFSSPYEQGDTPADCEDES